MKTSKFLGLALSVLTLAACSQDDDLFQNNDAPQTTIENNQIGKVIEMGATGNQSSIATFVVPAGTKTVDVVYNNGEKKDAKKEPQYRQKTKHEVCPDYRRLPCYHN